MGKLLVISLIISLIGIFALLIISINQENLTGSAISKVSVTGKILDVKKYDEFNIIRLENITVICYQCDFRPGETITATGIISQYQGKNQLDAEEIKLS